MVKALLRLFLFVALNVSLGFCAFKLFDVFFPVLKAEDSRTFSQVVVDKNGRPLRAFADQKGVWRYPTDLHQVSPYYLQALINYEDKQFWQHGGINPFSLLRAAFQFIRYGRAISGGSTLTMQVARILEPHKKSISGKLWQMIRAFQLEYHYSKEEILNLYLNFAPFGGPVEGIEAATYTYLGKSALHLSLSESALMAVLPQSPSRLRPDRYFERAQKARNKVLKRMLSYGVWQAADITDAMQEPVIAQFNSRPMYAPLLARYLVNKNPQSHILHSTIDLEIQLTLSDLVKNYAAQFSESTSASALVMNNQNLEVVAYVGAADFANTKRFGHIDMNRAVRSPGSTLKPFIYAMAMDKNLIHSQSMLQDIPLQFADYSPENFTKKFMGPVSVSNALQTSLNIPAVQVLNHLGTEQFSSQLENAGLKLFLPKGTKPSLSLALGGVGVRLIDLVMVYRGLTNQGLAGKPRYLKNEPVVERYLVSPEAAWIISEILADIPLTARQKSPYLKQSKIWLAHKTGTSYGYRDAWMIAATATHTIAVWVGKPDGTPSPGEFGRKTAAPLVKRILNLLPQQNKYKRVMPERVTSKNICWPLGLTEENTQQQHCHQKFSAYLIDDVAPATLQENNNIEANPVRIHLTEADQLRSLNACYTGKTKSVSIALWPTQLEYWLPEKFHRKQLIPAYTPSCLKSLNLTQDLVITGIKDKSQIIQPGELNKALALNLSVMANRSQLTWLINGELKGKTKQGESFLIENLTKGNYRVFVYNQQGQKGELAFEVL
ncbi:penicillin-binding protein 1C [Aliikangiella sp. IMCC44359]|uniref:penicillin-binding protein 1C n=1 Tax=Aliikangiella sp. IMCC44359 TaxID=3459125 RepID=UPI00403B12D4